MLRFFYRWLLRFHPARFRERFAEEMLLIFDHAETRTAAELVADAFISLLRQWTMRSEYWEEQPTLSALTGAGGLPGFYTLESFKPRKSALIGGAVLTWIACSVVFLVLSHSRVHYVYVPSVSFESTAGPDVELPTSIPNLAPTPVRVRPRTQSAIEPRTNLSEAARPSLGKAMPSKANSSVRVSESVGIADTYGQSATPSFQYVVAAGGELRGSSTNYTAHPGSRQPVYFSKDRLTIAATIEVEDIREGVARLKVRAKSYPGRVDSETSEKELQSVLPREYTYVPLEKLSMPVDGGGVLSLVGAVADEAGNVSKPLASYPVEPEPGQLLLMFPALLRGDRVLVNLKTGGAGTGLRGNPAVALYAPPDGLFIFALQPFEGATSCKVLLGRAVCRLEGNEYTLFSARPIAGGDQQSKIWVLHLPNYIPSRVGASWRDHEGSIQAGELFQLLRELRVEGSASRP